jgi:hypothetical protein
VEAAHWVSAELGVNEPRLIKSKALSRLRARFCAAAQNSNGSPRGLFSRLNSGESAPQAPVAACNARVMDGLLYRFCRFCRLEKSTNFPVFKAV